MKAEESTKAGPGKWWRDPLGWVMAALLVFYAVQLGMHMRAYGSGADPSGYLNNAKILGSGRMMVDPRTIPGLDVKKFQPMSFVPYAFRPGRHGKMYPVYSPGLSVAVLCAALVTGWNAAPGAAMLAMALLGILATVWLCLEMGLPRRWAWLGGALLAASPMFFAMSTVLMSDAPALTSVACAVVLAWKSRARPVWALAAGAVFAYGIFVRATNALAIFPLAVCFGFAWRRWIFFDLGGFPGAVIWCLYNKLACGHLFQTGYGDSSALLGSLFSWAAIRGAWLCYTRWLPWLIPPVWLFALGLPLLLRRNFSRVLMLMAWMLAFFCFYAADRDTGAKTNLRYLLPAFPACIAGALMVIYRLFDTDAARRLGAAAPRALRPIGPALAIAAVVVYAAYARPLYSPDTFGTYSATYKTATDWANDHLPPNSVVTCATASGSVYCYTPFTIVRWEWMVPEQWRELVAVCEADHRPIYAVVVPPYDIKELIYHPQTAGNKPIANANELVATLPGTWKPIGTAGAASFWQLDMTESGAAPSQP